MTNQDSISVIGANGEQQEPSLWDLFNGLPDSVQVEMFQHMTQPSKRNLRFTSRAFRQLFDDSIRTVVLSRLPSRPQEAAAQASAFSRFTGVRCLRIDSDGMSSEALKQFVAHNPVLMSRVVEVDSAAGIMLPEQTWVAVLEACTPHQLQSWGPSVATRRRPGFLDVLALLGSQQTCLTSLDLSLSRVTDETLSKVVARQLVHIQSLDLSGCKVTDEGISQLSALRALAALTVDKTAITGAGFAALKTLPSLSTLTLGLVSSFTYTGCAAVASLPHLTHLVIVQYPHGFKHLGALSEPGRAAGSGLRSLSLEACTLEGPALQAVAQLAGLTHLDLSNSTLTDDRSEGGLGALAQLKQLKQLVATDTVVRSPEEPPTVFHDRGHTRELCDLRLRSYLPQTVAKVLVAPARLWL